MMKSIVSASVCMCAVCLMGCASSETRISSPLGPRPGATTSAEPSGTLQVFSAHQKVDSDINFEEFFAGAEALREFDEPAHTDYSLCSRTGEFLRRVQNARDSQDAEPTLLPLPPGRYQVKAEAEGADCLRTRVIVPVIVEAGRTTRVHLEAPWKPNRSVGEAKIVHLPNGQPVGWRATPAHDSSW